MKQIIILFVLLLVILEATASEASPGQHTLHNTNGGKKYGGAIHLNENEEPRSFDPAQISEKGNIDIAENIYDRLLEYDENLNVRPSLAKSMPEISPDGLIYTFHLRTDVYFHDDPCFPGSIGRKFTARDVLYCWTRSCDPRTRTLAMPYFEIIQGAQEYYADPILHSEGVKGIQTPDDSTFVVTLTTPFSPFIDYCATVGFICPREAIERYGDDFIHHAVGTGPFKLVDYEAGNYCLLLRNQHYWGKDPEDNQLPYLDSVRFTFVQDSRIEMLEFKAGRLDHKYRIPSGSFENVFDKSNRLKDEYRQYQIGRVAANSTQFYGFNCEMPGVSNVHLRRAISLAIDRKKIVADILGEQASGPGDYGLVPPSMLPNRAINGMNFNPAKARKELGIAKKELNGKIPEIKLCVNQGGGRNQQVAQAVISMVKDCLGIDIQIEIRSWPDLTELIDAGKAPFFRLGWISDYPNPQSFLALLYGNNIPSSGPSSMNLVRYRNSVFDRLYEEALRETNRSKALNLWAQCDRVAVEDAAMVILYYDEDFHLLQPWVMDFPINSQNDNAMKHVWFSQ
ncbi:MAG: ABC transporter substrate-binding protein [Bacteroidota bacterium]|nr:ABC transporter substrate-binding protein [Bacteroidota bacterium]